MSAIAGVVFTDGRDVSGEFLAAMAQAAVPRGFDGLSAWHSGPAGMIRFHHATTPEAVGEKQPLAGPSGAVMAFDGRLDNRADLLALLGARGAVLGGAPDIEIALALFESRGEAFLNDLVGDWALAIWQSDARRLFCARSPMGWRPLLWSFERGVFGFATEPRTLVVGLGLNRQLNEGAIAEMLSARFVSNNDSFWSEVQRLGQGAAMTLENGRIKSWQWHTGPFAQSRLSDTDTIERFRELLDQALIASMRSSTPVIAHLSGGLDSSTVVTRATELHRAGRIDRQVNAISSRFPGEPHDETEWSSAVERHLGIAARVTSADSYRIEDAQKWCAETLQLPMRPNVFDAFVPTARDAQAHGERVLLTGEGGDDWTAGNFGYLPDMLLRGDLFGLLREGLTQFPEESRFVGLRRTGFLALAPIVSPQYRTRLQRPHLHFNTPLPSWIRPEWAKQIGLEERWQSTVPLVNLPGFAQKQRYATFAVARRYIAHDPIMAHAEAHGVEIRHPFHDLRLTSFLMGVQGRMLRRNGEKKFILREAMRGTLPEVVRTRQSKAQFVSSIVDAIAERFRTRPPAELIPAKLGWIDPARIEAMFAPIQAWRQSGTRDPLMGRDLGPIWFAVSMDLWLENAAGL